MNRLREYLGELPEDRERDGDYREIESRYTIFYVSAATAREVERVLELQPLPLGRGLTCRVPQTLARRRPTDPRTCS
jgi:hypothetical protein